MVCEVCRAGPAGVSELGALWASEGTKREQRGDGEPSAVCPAGVSELGALWASEGTRSASSA